MFVLIYFSSVFIVHLRLGKDLSALLPKCDSELPSGHMKGRNQDSSTHVKKLKNFNEDDWSTFTPPLMLEAKIKPSDRFYSEQRKPTRSTVSTSESGSNRNQQQLCFSLKCVKLFPVIRIFSEIPQIFNNLEDQTDV